MKLLISLLFALILLNPYDSFSKAKKENKDAKDTTNVFNSGTISGLELRHLGPGVTSGRITDIAVNPNNVAEYYVAVACGGVWKTTNAGISFSPIFDGQKSFSIGCVTIDPNNQFCVWVGTGENNSQRSVSYGDGVYKSLDGGKSWKCMGLEKSEHIGKIIIDPRNSNFVWVAAQGPLWGPGGDRGLYKSTNAGETWECVLKISENTGVTDIAIDPRNPDVIFAASYQRRRHVWTLINGGPESAIHKSTDGGKTWNKLTNGLPGGDLGRIGIAVSPVNPDLVFATIEADEKGGFFRSSDRGASWEKRNPWFSPAAQYYQELVCDPRDEDIVYNLDTYLRVTTDGGRTFTNVSNKHRHVDDHAIWINPNNTNHLLIGGDGGLYESLDKGSNFRFFSNLPVTQYYRVGIDNSEPFYYVYGGTQDNNSWGGPSRTTNSGGITNEDWFLVVGGDGYQARVDPNNPNIVYAQWQYGNLVRYDRKSGEVFYIQPQAEKGEEVRWNWDTPLIISPHNGNRIYIAANRLYRSDDQGNTWRAISPDLTRKIQRNLLPVMGKIQNPDAVSKNASTSLFGNIVSLIESPLKENLIYVGTDDGLIQVTDDAGGNWTKYATFAGVPETTYVSDICASQHNDNVVYASFDNHKNADFKPYLLKSEDRGKSWKSIAGNLPENGVVYTIVEDFKNSKLLFCGTEFGLFCTVDGGENWVAVKSGLPPIAVRDLEIQKRENDLVLATFGRGFYILDNYSALRDVNPDLLKKDVHIFPVKDALMFNEDESFSKWDQGESFFRTKNPPFGATITYYQKEGFKTKKQLRKEAESKAEKDGKTIDYPTNQALIDEDKEEAPYLIFNIMNENNNIVRTLTSPVKTGINRITWDLRYPDMSPVGSWTDANNHSGTPVLPGKYKVTVMKSIDGVITQLSDTVSFITKVLNNVTLAAKDRAALVEFQQKTARLQRGIYGTGRLIGEMKNDLTLIKKSLFATKGTDKALIEKVRKVDASLNEISEILNGNSTLARRNENQPPPVNERLNYIISGLWSCSQAPTQTQKDAYRIAGEEFSAALNKLKSIVEVDIKDLNKELDRLGSPWTPGRIPDWKPE